MSVPRKLANAETMLPTRVVCCAINSTLVFAQRVYLLANVSRRLVPFIADVAGMAYKRLVRLDSMRATKLSIGVLMRHPDADPNKTYLYMGHGKCTKQSKSADVPTTQRAPPELFARIAIDLYARLQYQVAPSDLRGFSIHLAIESAKPSASALIVLRDQPLCFDDAKRRRLGESSSSTSSVLASLFSRRIQLKQVMSGDDFDQLDADLQAAVLRDGIIVDRSTSTTKKEKKKKKKKKKEEMIVVTQHVDDLPAHVFKEWIDAIESNGIEPHHVKLLADYAQRLHDDQQFERLFDLTRWLRRFSRQPAAWLEHLERLLPQQSI
jgi:hypothetical protein